MRTTARTLAYAIALATLAAPLTASPKGAKPPISLTLATPKRPFRVGKPVILLATITNASARSLQVPLSGGTSDVGMIYQVHVLDAGGKPVPRKPFPPKGRIWVGSTHGTGLKPGQSRVDRLNLSYIYDLSRPGKYRVRIAEPLYRGPNRPNGFVKSNTVTITVAK